MNLHTMRSVPELFLFADIPGAGRFNMDCLSQQMAMEALCADVENLDKVQDADGDFIPIESWKGLKFDSDGNVSEIDFDCNQMLRFIPGESQTIGPGGSMHLQCIPQSVTSFSMQNALIGGTVDTSKLPRGLKKFDISLNCFFGEFNMAGLPDTLRVLNIPNNSLSGSLILSEIPRKALQVDISYNDFTGKVRFEDLPPEIRSFTARTNKLCGEISLQSIPRSVGHLDIRGNEFAQDVLVVRATDKPKYGRFRIDTKKFGKVLDDNGVDVTYWF